MHENQLTQRSLKFHTWHREDIATATCQSKKLATYTRASQHTKNCARVLLQGCTISWFSIDWSKNRMQPSTSTSREPNSTSDQLQAKPRTTQRIGMLQQLDITDRDEMLLSCIVEVQSTNHGTESSKQSNHVSHLNLHNIQILVLGV